MARLNRNNNHQPTLRHDLSFISLIDLPTWSTGPINLPEIEQLQAIKAAGYEGVQGADAKLARQVGLVPTAMGNIQLPGQMKEVCLKHRDEGYECITIHMGSGLESASEAARLTEDVLKASVETGFPVYIETHRATLTQDIWRTVELIKEFPEIELNIDFSHWYSGLEMPNGNWERKMEFMQPVFERAAYMHGRIGNSSHMQVNIGDGQGFVFVEHFRDLWTRTFRAFLASAKPGDILPFAPELLWPGIFYAREFPDEKGHLREESDRWEQSLVLRQIAQECFDQAQESLQLTA